jgi:hypothetical protein
MSELIKRERESERNLSRRRRKKKNLEKREMGGWICERRGG